MLTTLLADAVERVPLAWPEAFLGAAVAAAVAFLGREFIRKL
jgi:hypothetical protein